MSASKSETWIAAMKNAGHVPQMFEGCLDTFAMDTGYHNGPGCQTCGISWCWHCATTDDIRPCRAISSLNEEGKDK